MTNTYLETLLLYYEEEIEGDGYFRAFADRLPNPDHKEKMILMADVERHAAAEVAPLLQKYDLQPRSTEELVSDGQAAALRADPDWNASLAEMRQTFPGYIDDFLNLEAMAPSEDRARLVFLTDHEHAAIEFLELESAGAPDSAAPLRAYLAARHDQPRQKPDAAG